MTLVFNETAFKHGVTVKDIDCAMAVPLVDEDTANVFHAMKCRKEFYKYIPGRF